MGEARFFARLRELGFSSYQEYLRSEHWADVRRRYWASRLPKRCHGCGSVGPLDLHHRTYKNIGHERLMDLQLVCRDCHSAVHDFQRRTSSHMWGATNKVLRRVRKEAPLP